MIQYFKYLVFTIALNFYFISQLDDIFFLGEFLRYLCAISYCRRKNDILSSQFSKVMKLKRSQNNLPIKQYEKEIIYAVESNQVVIIAGDTGCGKSTQVILNLLPEISWWTHNVI